VTAVAPEPGTVEVWRGSLDAEPHVRQRLEAMLSDDEQERAGRFRFERDRARFVVGRGLLRALLARYVGAAGSQLRFGYGAQQKPVLLDDGPHFNLAHSGGTALFAFSRTTELGIDVELLQPEFAHGPLAERFFSPREVETLRALPEDDQPQAFFACWTRKEAILKARGDGLTQPLDSFDVTLTPGEPAALLRMAWSLEDPSRWQLVDLSDFDRGEVAALAAPATGWRCTFQEIDLTTLVYN
jgi:4'-phosphopantetheinyl transferase